MARSLRRGQVAVHRSGCAPGIRERRRRQQPHDRERASPTCRNRTRRQCTASRPRQEKLTPSRTRFRPSGVSASTDRPSTARTSELVEVSVALLKRPRSWGSSRARPGSAPSARPRARHLQHEPARSPASQCQSLAGKAFPAWSASKLATGTINAFKMNGLAGLGKQGRREVIVPAEMA